VTQVVNGRALAAAKRSPRAVPQPTEEMAFELLMIAKSEVGLGIRRHVAIHESPQRYRRCLWSLVDPIGLSIGVGMGPPIGVQKGPL
jgi:hypothetical protein